MRRFVTILCLLASCAVAGNGTLGYIPAGKGFAVSAGITNVSGGGGTTASIVANEIVVHTPDWAPTMSNQTTRMVTQAGTLIDTAWSSHAAITNWESLPFSNCRDELLVNTNWTDQANSSGLSYDVAARTYSNASTSARYRTVAWVAANPNNYCRLDVLLNAAAYPDATNLMIAKIADSGVSNLTFTAGRAVPGLTNWYRYSAEITYAAGHYTNAVLVVWSNGCPVLLRSFFDWNEVVP